MKADKTWACPSIRLNAIIIYSILILTLIAVVYPILWTIMTSLKSDQEIFANPFALPTVLNWNNYLTVFYKLNFGRYFINSAVVTTVSLVLVMILSSMTAYALAKFEFRWSRLLEMVFIAGLVVPVQLVVVPLFFIMKNLGLLNSIHGIITVYVAYSIPFSVFMLISFFRSLPDDLRAAAYIDGCTELQAFFYVMLPLAKPGLIAIAIFNFIGLWNEYFLAFMFLSGKGSEMLQTLPLGLASISIVSQYKSEWGVIFAGNVMVMLPTLIVYVLLQRHIIKGIAFEGLKG
jgi:ABC-type glycerol-3-phosphate transport system permease component